MWDGYSDTQYIKKEALLKNQKKSGPKPLNPYPEDVENFMKDTYFRLSEKERRSYAAVEALMLADGGSCNPCFHYIFKEDLQNLSDEIGVEIRIAHYPPYTSKWNPVEHKVFPHITRSLKGVILKSYDLVKNLIEKTTTQTG